MRFSNPTTAQVLGVGSLFFYVDPSSKEVTYAIDGEDNRNFYSYSAMREGVVANPVHLNSFDLWFTNFYSYPEIKGFANLREESDVESFELTEERIKRDANKSFDNSLVGKITADNKIIFDSGNPDRDELRYVTGHFYRLNLLKENDTVYINGEEDGSVEALLKEPDLNQEYNFLKEHEVIDLVDQYLRGSKMTAGEKLFNNYEKLIKGIVNKYCNHMEVAEDIKDDLLQESYLKFLTQLREFNPKKGKLSTFVYYTIDGLVRNAVNRRYSSTPEVPCENLDSFSGESKNELDEYIDDDFFNKIIASLPDPVGNTIRMYFFENRTYDYIGKRLGITKERVRQRIEKGLELMRYNPNIKVMLRNAENAKIALIFSPKK